MFKSRVQNMSITHQFSHPELAFMDGAGDICRFADS